MRTVRGLAVVLTGLITLGSIQVVAATGSVGAATTAHITFGGAEVVEFGTVSVGSTVGPGVSDTGQSTFELVNNNSITVTINMATGVTYSSNGGAGTAADYSLVAGNDCPGAGTGIITLTAGAQCLMLVYFHPSAVGQRYTNLNMTAEPDGTSASLALFGSGGPPLTATPASVGFGDVTLGTFASENFTLENSSTSTDTFNLSSSDLSFSGVGADDYVVIPGADCPGNGVNTVILASTVSCQMEVDFYPGALGDRAAVMTLYGSSGNGVSVNLDGSGTIGYYQVDSSGNVGYSGDAGYYGDAGSIHLNKPIVGMAATGDDGGYWLVATDGGIFNYGDANFYGSTGAIHLNKPIVGMAGTPDAGGYWLVASDGGIFNYGDANFYGSTGAIHLNKPIVGMAPTPDGNGYWLVASDGGIFSYGDANFYGSTGAIHLNKPIVGMAPTPNGNGYWLVASDGGIFSYGDASFFGSTGAIHLAQPIVAMASMPTGGGYWFSAADGGLFNFGDAPFLGSGVGTGLGTVVDMTSDGGPTVQAIAGIPAVRQAPALGQVPEAHHVPHFAGP